MTARIFSPKCGKCRQKAVVLVSVPYTTQIDHDGRKYTVTLPNLTVPRCSNCGTVALDEEANREISAAFRQQAGLLSPEQIRRQRQASGLTQQALAEALGVAVSTLSRWETGGQIQQRCLDRFLRAFFDLPDLRQRLLADPAPAPAEVPCVPAPAGMSSPSEVSS
jgi:putative zinc finger/helix-turn-helix YgiT family protein